MDFNVAKQVRFYSDNEVKDVINVAERIVYDQEFSHWVLYSTYIYTGIILCIAYTKLEAHEMPEVKVSEIREKLKLSAEELKEYFLTVSMTHFPKTVYVNSQKYLQDFLKTKPKEGESCVEAAREYFEDFFSQLEK